MSQYYLMAQLPSLDALPEHASPPITEERFLELCRALMPKKAQTDVSGLTLTPKKEGECAHSPLLRAFYDGERKLRIILGALRAKKMNKPFDMEANDASVALLQTAKAAIECTDPLEAEMLLSKYRLEFLESLRPADAFSDDAVFYYALRLKLLWRIARFDTDKGEQAYRNIYSSIIGEEQEVLR